MGSVLPKGYVVLLPQATEAGFILMTSGNTHAHHNECRIAAFRLTKGAEPGITQVGIANESDQVT